MPAFAAFTKIHIGESAFYKSLQSRLSGTTKNSSLGTVSKKNLSKRKLYSNSSDSSSRPQQEGYFELDEPGNKTAGTTVRPIPGVTRDGRIIKSVDIQQSYSAHS